MSLAIRFVLRLRSVATIREDPNRIAEWPRPQVALSAWTAANRRITASSVGPAPPGAWPPCVHVLLGFRRPCTNELTNGTTSGRELADPEDADPQPNRHHGPRDAGRVRRRRRAGLPDARRGP